MEFYKKAFGFDVKFLHESKAYGELQTGETTLAFASHEMGDLNLSGKFLKLISVINRLVLSWVS